MIKTLAWLQDRLVNGTKDTGSTIIVLDSVDCKNLLRDINQFAVAPRKEDNDK